MNTTTDIAVRDKAQRGQEARPRATVAPHVDIFEDSNGVTLVADMPGVPRDCLDIRVESDRLFIRGEARLGVPQGFKLHHAEIREPVYERTFGLGKEMDASRIGANLKDGVLVLTIPRSEQAKPRKIEIQTA